jgi:hypothetical protein
MNKEVQADSYAKRAISIYRAPEGTHTATETKDKAERRNRRKQKKTVEGSVDAAIPL